MLNFTKTNHLETTLIMKFKNTNFTGKLELTITDPHREYYRPDIFSFSGERILFDFSKGICDLLFQRLILKEVNNQVIILRPRAKMSSRTWAKNEALVYFVV